MMLKALNGLLHQRVFAVYHSAVHRKIDDARQKNEDNDRIHAGVLADWGWKFQLFFC